MADREETVTLVLNAKNLAGAAFSSVGDGFGKLVGTAEGAARKIGQGFENATAAVSNAFGNLTENLLQGGDLGQSFLMLGSFLAGQLAEGLIGQMLEKLAGTTIVEAIAGSLATLGSTIGGVITAAIPVGMALWPVLLVAAIGAGIAFLIANPDDRNFGGGYNGGRLTLEIPRVYDALPSFEHECLHAFLNAKEKALTALLRTDATGLDWQTFNEGLAYALAPGLLRPDGAGDPLAKDVAADTARGARLADSYARFHRFGLALRSLLRDALDDPKATVESFAPRAIDVWRALQELDAVSPPSPSPPRR